MIPNVSAPLLVIIVSKQNQPLVPGPLCFGIAKAQVGLFESDLQEGIFKLQIGIQLDNKEHYKLANVVVDLQYCYCQHPRHLMTGAR